MFWVYGTRLKQINKQTKQKKKKKRKTNENIWYDEITIQNQQYKINLTNIMSS